MHALRPLGRHMRWVRSQLPPLNFITLHYAYFILTCLIFAVIFWGASTPPRHVSFINSLFLCVSAMTLAGLNTVNLSELNTFQQTLLFLLLILGSAVWVSAFVVALRRRAFQNKFMDIERKRDEARGRSRTRRMKTCSERALGRRSTEVQPANDEGPAEPDRLQENEKMDGTTPANTRDVQSQEDDSITPFPKGVSEWSGIYSAHGGKLDMDTDIERSLTPEGGHIAFHQHTRFGPSHPSHASAFPQIAQPIRRPGNQHSFFNMQGVGARPSSSLRTRMPSLEFENPDPFLRTEHISLAPQKSQADISKYIQSAAGWISRNSQFHGLTDKEREELGGCEYRAVTYLSYLVPLYFVLWQFLGAIGCGAWVAYNQPDVASQEGLNPWWVGIFNAVSAFNNSGMSLLDANMIAFQRSYYLLLTMGLLILAGNTCYPIFLRLIIWTTYKLVQRTARDKAEKSHWSERARTLKFLLDHPRRCYTNLFPAQHTWWLALGVFTLNAVDWAAFELLNIGNSELNTDLPTNIRVIDGLFQAFAVRSGGFYVVSIPSLRVSLQLLYVIMMYISVYPVVITMRNSNVYEERSLGIYAEDEYGDKKDVTDTALKPGLLLSRARIIREHFLPTSRSSATSPHESNSDFVRHQLRAQLAHDAWWIVVALFVIMIFEAHSFHKDPVTFSVFNFIFETVSAYGCVGISVGVPWNQYSFSGAWGTPSKLILCAVMLRGRHRGLPVAIDKAVLLPGETDVQGVAEEEDGMIRIAHTRTISRGREWAGV